MPLRDGRIPVITSVLDRLAGDATNPAAAPRPGTIGTVRPGTLTALRNSVLRDLEHLLNTRREEQLIPPEYHESAASLLNFGLPDLSVYTLKNAADQHRLRRSMEAALRFFEPRLSNVSIALDGWDESKPILRFRVEAVLKVEPAPEPVVFDTEFSLDSGKFSLKGASAVNSELLPYYERELLFIRQMAADFAEQYPDRAAALKLDGRGSEDPHVERLVESFALIAGRIQRKIEDEFPEITEALLDVLYPHYLRPIPSMAIVQFEADPEQGSLTSGYVVPRGSSLYSAPVGGTACRFRTAYPVKLWPLEIVSAGFTQSSQLGAGFAAGDAPYALRLGLRCHSGTELAKLGIHDLRFLLSGDPQAAHTLYELLFNNLRRVMVRRIDEQRNTPLFTVPSPALRQLGFNRDEEMLPYSDRSFQGYRLLQEYFAFPEKFLFFDLVNLDRIPQAGLGQHFEVLFLFGDFERRDRIRVLEQVVDRSMFHLGCAPVVNLFDRYAEPIRLSHTQTEYRVIPDIHAPMATEVYSVNRVSSVAPNSGEQREYRPFYSFRHSENGVHEAFWQAVRRPSERHGDKGTEVFLSLLDLNFKPNLPPVESLSVEVTCTNRDLPERLPVTLAFGELDMESATVLRIRFVHAPTPAIHPPLRRGLQWRLISHLSLNHLSIVTGGVEALREVLKLYDFTGNPAIARQILGIAAIASRSKVARVSSPHGLAFCPGVHVDLSFDEEQYVGSGVFLLASVLERFFGLYSGLNSFSQLNVTTLQRKGALREWPPRAGEQIVL